MSVVQRFTVLAVLMVFVCTSVAQVRFVEEDLTFTIYRDADSPSVTRFQVSGTYTFQSDRPDLETSVVYPFPQDAPHGPVDTLSILKLPESTQISPTVSSVEGVTIPLQFHDSNELVLQIVYSHTILDNRAEYILTSTRSWGRPLVQADFKLLLDSSLSLVSTSFPADSCVTETDRTTSCFWHRENFLPDRNMIIVFRKRD